MPPCARWASGTGDAVSVEDYVRHVVRNNISCNVSSNAKLADNGAYELAPDYIPSPGCLEYCAWEGSSAARTLELVGLNLGKLGGIHLGFPFQASLSLQAIELRTDTHHLTEKR